MLLLDSSGHPREPLLALVDLYGVAHDGTAEGLHRALQREWYQRGTVRADIPERHGHHRAEALALLQELGFLEEVSASPAALEGARAFPYALLLGASLAGVRRRLGYLLCQWQQGVRFQQLVLLGSTRLLRPDHEGAVQLLAGAGVPLRPGWQPSAPLPRTEADMMSFVLAQSDLPQWSAQLITTPQQPVQPTGFRLPNTRDTVFEWLRTDPRPGACLAVSSQPFVQYQQLVVRSALPPSFTVDACGPAAPAELPITLLLDNVAKQLYEELGAPRRGVLR